MKKQDDFVSILGGYTADAATKRFTERTFNIFEDSEHLVELAQKWKNVAADKAQGHMFEQLEVIKFNLDALKKDSELFAKTTASMGFPTDPVDIIISNGKDTLREVQAKSCNSAARSAFALSNEKYQEMQRLAPQDQVEKIKELLEKRIEAGTLKAEDYEQTYRNLTESLEYGNVRSAGTTYDEALKATDANVAEVIANQSKLEAAFADMHESGKRAGNIGAALSGATSSVTEFYQVYNGECELGEATVNIAISTAKGYATGYTVTALSKGITHSATHFLGTGVSKALARSNAPVAIASGIISSSKSMISYLKGDIELEQLSDEITHTAITSSASFYYGALGQVMIPIPVVGSIVGAGVGYMIGNLIHQSGLVALGDSQLVKIAKERRRQIQALCLAAVPQIRQNRLALQQQLDQHFELRKQLFMSAFDSFDLGVNDWEPNQCLEALNTISDQFGSVLPYKSFEEFDQMMCSEDSFKF
ncbi:TPA: hypothetical protein RQJ99_003988 [Vibrio vulnificus]|nr:hypothetical protein [Vibrio vulnificus]